MRLLDDDLSDRLLVAAKPGQVVRLGTHDYEITEEPRLAECVSWQALRRWPGTRAWQVRFITPACLRRGSRTSPWPAPESVARGLAERWHRLDPNTAPPCRGPGAGPVGSDLEGHNEVQILTRNVRREGRWRLEDEVISGFVGRIRYVCDRGTDAEAAAFDALMAFAAFAARRLAHHLRVRGGARPEPTWRPPTIRAGGQ